MAGVDQGLLAALARADREEFERRAARRHYREGAALFHEGDPSDWVLGLVEGRVKISALTHDGREVVLAICEPGEVLGELSAVDGQPRSATATAIEDVTVLMMGVDDFGDFLDERPGVASLLLRSIAGRLRDADRRDVEYVALDSVGRIAARLVDLASRFGIEHQSGAVHIELPITQDELAGWSGCSREAVGKALQQLRRREIVETGRRAITILDLEALRIRAGR